MKTIPVYAIDQATQMDRVEVVSAEGCAYTVAFHINGQRHHLAEKKGHSKRFNSIDEVYELLKGHPCKDIFLIQDLAYDEMIGQVPENALKNEIRITLN